MNKRKPFNCTMKELKYTDGERIDYSWVAYNRTMKELKCVSESGHADLHLFLIIVP